MKYSSPPRSRSSNGLFFNCKIIILPSLLLIGSFSGCIYSGEDADNDSTERPEFSPDEESNLDAEIANDTLAGQSNLDTDLDGIPNYLDLDDDGDGVMDSEDEFPLNSSESFDFDGDGVGDNLDEDDDGDGWDDQTEALCFSNPINASIVPIDKDDDLLCDPLDADFLEIMKQFQFLGPNRDFLIFAGSNPEWYAINMTTWQIEHGGWEKWNEDEYQSAWDENSSRSFYNSNGIDLGSLADQATTGEIRFLSSVFGNSTNETNKSIIRNSVELGIQFVLDAQHPSGGWPQVYPDRICSGCNYTALMTFNDFVIPNALLLLHDISEGIEPFDTDIVSNINFSQVNSSINMGMDFILKSQVVVDGVPTIWGQQHHPTTFESLPGRSYELACRASGESAGVTLILLNWKNRTPEIDNATWWSVRWFEETMVSGYAFDQHNGTIIESPGAMMWYRYYNVTDNQHFMAGRDGIKVYDLEDLTEERRTGYRWAFNWAQGIIVESSKVFENTSSVF